MSEKSTLFRTTLLALFREMKMSEKLLLLDSLLEEVHTTRIKILRVEVYRVINGDLLDSSYFTEIVGRILRRLDPSTFPDSFIQRIPVPNFPLEYYLPATLYSHPYLIQIFRRLGNICIPTDTDIHLTAYDIPLDHSFRENYPDSRIPPMEIYRRYFGGEKLKTPEEVDQIIDEYLREKNIKLDPEVVKSEVQKLDCSDRPTVL